MMNSHATALDPQEGAGTLMLKKYCPTFFWIQYLTHASLLAFTHIQILQKVL